MRMRQDHPLPRHALAPPARSARGSRAGPLRLLIAGAVAAVLLIGFGVMTLHRGRAPRPPVVADGALLPGITLDVAAGGALVVTSLRSRDARQRGGVRVGDRLEAVDGVRVASRAGLAHLLAQDPSPSLSLRLARGPAMVDVRLDRRHRSGHDDP